MDVGATAAGLWRLGEAGQKIVALLGGDGRAGLRSAGNPRSGTHACGAVDLWRSLRERSLMRDPFVRRSA